MKNFNLQFKIIGCLAIGALIFICSSVFASEFFFDTDINRLTVGQQFQLDVLLNTENETINAVGGKIIFPGYIFELKGIKDASSVIDFWVEQPESKPEQVVFSGVIPGGYLGEKGLLLSLIFQAKKEGQGKIEIQDGQVLLNDGKGTAASFSTSPYQFSVDNLESVKLTTDQPQKLPSWYEKYQNWLIIISIIIFIYLIKKFL